MRQFNVRSWALVSSFVAAESIGCWGGAESLTHPGRVSDGSGRGGGGGSGDGGGGGKTGSGGSGGTDAGVGGDGRAGSGGVSGGGDAGASSVCSGVGTHVLTIDQHKVDDFEGATLSPAWATYSDVMPTANAFKMTQEAGGAMGTAHYGHYAGTGAKTPVMGGFGVGAIYNVAIDPPAGIYCVDVSAFRGLTFWAKAATAGARIGVNFVLPETNARQDGGDCVTSCYLHPSKTVTLTADWAQYAVTFAEATGGSAKVSNRLQQLGWLSPDSSWNFSLDEIQFY